MIREAYETATTGIGTDGAWLDPEIGLYTADKNEANDPEMQRRWRNIQEYSNRYFDVLSRTGMADTAEARATKDWIRSTQLTSMSDIQESIVWREEFFRGQGKDVIEHGLSLYENFRKMLTEAKPYIAKKSETKWMKRLRDNSHAGFQAKRYWVEHQFPMYVRRWKKVAERRDKMAENSKLKELASRLPEFGVILRREAFLELHYDKRSDLLAQANARMLAEEKLQTALYTEAKGKLGSAAFMNILSENKIGEWLERIFKSNASPQKIEDFVRKAGPKTLEGLIDNWTKVKFRYDMLKDKTGKLDQDAAARGLTIMPEHQFLSMHYTQRLRYVEELDRRINGTGEINNTRPVFLEIRHEMDTQEWDVATELIEKAKLMQLTEKERESLRSMERYVNQFKPREKADLSSTDPVAVSRKIDLLVDEIGQNHSEMKPMVERLLKGPNANRSIHQLRWMAYNNVWCETHGFLNRKVARFGARKEHEVFTHEQAIRGRDVGRHNNISYTTDDRKYLRKTEIVRHKATYEHLNVKDGSAVQQMAEWCENEQHPRDLYWRTLCCHTDGDPKSNNWHRDWFQRLTQLRSITRTLKNAGFQYKGYGIDPEPLNGGTALPATSTKQKASAGYAMAA